MSTSLILYYLRSTIETVAWGLLLFVAAQNFRRLRHPGFVVQLVAVGMILLGLVFYWFQELGAVRHPPQWVLEASVWIYTVSLAAFAIGSLWTIPLRQKTGPAGRPTEPQT